MSATTDFEIERKFLVDALPESLTEYPGKRIRQAYICREPVIRIRQLGEDYILTIKGKGMLVREEHELPLTKESFEELLTKTSGRIIEKTRYRIPLTVPGTYQELVAELDVFSGDLSGLLMVEVEFPDVKSARGFVPPSWFGREVTEDPAYTNSELSKETS